MDKSESELNCFPTGWPEWLDTTNHIGSHYPYYLEGDYNKVSLSFSEICEEVPETERTLDIAGIAEILFRGYPLGNRTLVTGIRKVPWMAKPGDGEWARHSVPDHGSRRLDEDVVVSRLREGLRNEVLRYAGNAGRIGILLSGGMDSRIVAGIVRELQLSNELRGEVTALTWGFEESRDVRYAAEIARRFGWDLEHYPITAELLWENVHVMGRLGAEAPPYHLHALPEIRNETELDVILAGSYGNSVGRGIFAGDWLRDVNDILPCQLNPFGLLRQNALNHVYEDIIRDAYSYKKRVDRTETYQYREIERQLHYMRRGLQPWMTHVAERIPVYQLFTSPEIVSLMWGLDPAIRDDRYYSQIIKDLPDNIGDIPYAKTGMIFGKDSATADDGYKYYNNYGNWMRRDLRNDITTIICNSKIRDMGVFNMESINRLINIWGKADTVTVNKIDKTISWLASLSVFLTEYDVRCSRSYETYYIDRVNSIYGRYHAMIYRFVRGLMRK